MRNALIFRVIVKVLETTDDLRHALSHLYIATTCTETRQAKSDSGYGGNKTKVVVYPAGGFVRISFLLRV